MKIVIDTNVFMAGLLSDSVVRRLLVSGKAKFYLPEFALEEIEKYRENIIERAGCTKEEFELLKQGLLEGIIMVNEIFTRKHMKEAISIMAEIDRKDAVFIACALAINADGILSFDKDISRQKRVKCFEVKDLT